jgi:mono/diheme cytochrome c family protein
MARFAATGFINGKLALGALAMLAASLPAASGLASAEDPTAPLAAEQVEQGRQLFADWSCGTCHALADAKGTGSIGPALDGNANLSHDFVKDRVTNGQGAMPGFGGQMTDEEIDVLSQYIVHAKK